MRGRWMEKTNRTVTGSGKDEIGWIHGVAAGGGASSSSGEEFPELW
jgi:hypothetical protein